MTTADAATTPAGAGPGVTAYEVRLAGHLDDHWSAVLDDLTLVRLPDGTTALTGPIADQARLHGVLARVRDLGATLLSLRMLDEEKPDALAPSPSLVRPLRTDRLTLRAGTADDALATWAYRRLAAVGEWLTEVPTDPATYRCAFTEPGRLAATVVVERDGHVIGDFMLRVEDAWAQVEVAEQATHRQVELGWVLDPHHTGRGYAAEAARALLAHCFAGLGVHRVVASCFADNVASRRLMERLGMRLEGHAVADSLHRSGRWLDTLTYAVLADEWRHGREA